MVAVCDVLRPLVEDQMYLSEAEPETGDWKAKVDFCPLLYQMPTAI